MLDQHILSELQQKLLAEKQRLEKMLSLFATEDPKMKGDWDSQMPQFEPQESGSHTSLEEEADEVEEFEARLATEHSLESRLLEINKALERIGRGTFGVCSKCKKEISLERLRANPAAEFDMEHSQ